MTNDTPDPASYLTTREAADLLGVSLRSVQLWAEDGLLEYWKTGGGHRRITRASVNRVLAGNVARQAQPAMGAARPNRVAAGRRLRVLVVEDEPTLLRLYRLKLASWTLPVEVVAAHNGVEALLGIGKKCPDLLIADLYMPEMDGFQMLRKLRATPSLDRMEIIVVTGLSVEDIDRRGGLPADIQVLHKPIPFVEIERIARRIAVNLGIAAASADHA